MESIKIMSELNELDVLIAKKLFNISKLENNNQPPSPLQFKILKYLCENCDRIICQKDLENEYKVSRATISEVLFTMEKKRID